MRCPVLKQAKQDAQRDGRCYFVAARVVCFLIGFRLDIFIGWRLILIIFLPLILVINPIIHAVAVAIHYVIGTVVCIAKITAPRLAFCRFAGSLATSERFSLVKQVNNLRGDVRPVSGRGPPLAGECERAQQAGQFSG